MKTPTLFISHGAPLSAIEKSEATQSLGEFGASLLRTHEKPRAIIVMSAHGLTKENSVTITSGEKTSLIYDFFGFPDELYQIKYPAPGSPSVAAQARDLLTNAGFQVANSTQNGIDHGVWIPLLHMFPDANIPVIQISMPYFDSNGKPVKPEQIYKLGQALAPLRENGVLLIGSGGAVHNLGDIQWRAKTASPWALEFHNWVKDQLGSGQFEKLLQARENAPHFANAHPAPEHFYPLFFTLGTRQPQDNLKLISDEIIYGTLSLLSFSFG